MITHLINDCCNLLLLIFSLLFTYCLLEFLATRKVAKVFKVKCEELAVEQKNFDNLVNAQQAKWKKQAAEFAALKQSELAHIESLYVDAETKLQEANHIAQAAQEKVTILENKVNLLHSKLFNARERTKRLAKKAKTS